MNRSWARPNEERSHLPWRNEPRHVLIATCLGDAVRQLVWPGQSTVVAIITSPRSKQGIARRQQTRCSAHSIHYTNGDHHFLSPSAITTFLFWHYKAPRLIPSCNVYVSSFLYLKLFFLSGSSFFLSPFSSHATFFSSSLVVDGHDFSGIQAAHYFGGRWIFRPSIDYTHIH